MNILITVSLLSPASSQNTSSLNTLQNPYPNNYTLGFANNSCTRVSMFKFPSVSSGIASFLTLQFLPQLQPLTTNISLSLFSFSMNRQVGTTITSAFNTNYLGTTDVSLANWNFTSGKLYYLTIQPTLTDYVKIPWGASALSPTSVVLQQGSSCTTSQWAQFVTNDGSYIPVQILVQSMVTPLSLGNTVTPKITGSPLRNGATNLTKPSITPTPSPSQTYTLNLINSLSVTSSQSNSPSTTLSPPITPTSTLTTTPTPTPIQDLTPTQTPTLKLSFSGTTSPSPSNSESYSKSDSSSPSLTPTSQLLNSTGSLKPIFYQAQAVQSQEASPSLVAFSFFGSLVVLFCLAVIVLYARFYLCKKLKSPKVQSPISPTKKEPMQTLSPLILPMPAPNVWRSVTDGDETWYINSITNESVWVLPPGEIVMD